MNDSTACDVAGPGRLDSGRSTASRDLEDLDAAATVYAHAWMAATEQRRERLRADFVCYCLPFASRVAGRYRGRGESFEDLQQVARLGLLHAVDRYAPDRGSFTAFAVITIRGELKRHFRDRTWALHVTRRLQDLTLELRHATVVLTNTLKRVPDNAELARHLQVSEDDVREARLCRASCTPIPFSTPIGPEGSLELGDTVGDRDEALEVVTDRLTVTELVRLLPDRIQRLLAMRFHANLTQGQIAAEFGVSQMHVSRLLARALAWLRAAMLSDTPPPWAGGADGNRLDGVRTRVSRSAGTVTVRISGQVDRDNADRLRVSLRSAVATAANGRVVIDTTAMPLMDPAGVAVLRDAFVAGALANAEVTFVGG